jgi:pimeloyl-ACP methyl ester carboxylesterase
MRFHIITLLSPTLLLASVIPLPEGLFSVQKTDSELVDEHRRDPFEDSHARRLMVSHFHPVPRCSCKKVCKTQYMPDFVAKVEDEILVDYLSGLEWPTHLLATLEVESCCEVAAADTEPPATFPTVLFGSGFNTTRLFYTATAMQLASMGYEVYTIDHPYETDIVEFPNGDVIFGGRINDTADYEFGLDVRTQDVSFILDTLGIAKTVYIGHSYGGASAAMALINETRIVGGANLDGILYGRVQDMGVSRPFLTFGSAGHNTTSEPSWTRFFSTMTKNHPDVWTRELSVANSAHGSYWDMPLIGDITGLSANEELVRIFFGGVRGQRMMEIVREYLSDFIDFCLGGDEGLLARESAKYPEVDFLR